MTERARYSPAQLAMLLGLPEPTSEQAEVIAAPLEPLAVIAGAGSGKSETMAARLVWLVANGMVAPERVLGLTFTRKAAAELGQRVRARLAGLRRAGLAMGRTEPAGPAGPPGDGRPRGAPPPAEGTPDGEPVVSTYHAYAARLVADHALREALEPSLRLITPAVAWQIAARVVAGYGGPMDAVDRAPQWVTAAVLDLAGELAEHLRSPDDVQQVGRWLEAAGRAFAGRVPAQVRRIVGCQRTREQLLPMVAAYTRAKAAREVIDYGDQVALAARIASRHPQVGAIERARFQVVLLDEYQDTSHAQLVLLQALFGGGHPVTAVGDPCQSIYGWRGASAGNLRRFVADFPVTGQQVTGRRGNRPAGRGRTRPARVRQLSTSFRNTERVLDAAAALQEGLRAEAPLVPRLVPPPGRAGRGRVVCALLETAADEAAWVASQIEGLLDLPPGAAPDGDRWPEPGSTGLRAADVAVLCRKRSQFPALRAAIEARGIPVEVVGLGGLLTVPEVADVVATLRVLHDPTASGSLARLLTGPRWRIGPRDLVALGRRARDLAREHRTTRAGGPAAAGPAGPERGGAGAPGQQRGSVKHDDPLAQAVTDLTAEQGSLVEALDDLGPGAAYSAPAFTRFSALAAELRALRAHTGRPLPDLVGEVERVLGLDVEVAAQPWRDPAAARADLDAFADAASTFADDQEEPTLGAFLAYLTAAEAEEFGLESGRPSGTNAVTLTTVHAAKGLQWAAVVVPGLSAGEKARVFPARPVASTRWTENPRLLPFGLRGDARDLPGLPDLTARSLAAFNDACAARELAEERRLAYVAVTRAAFWVACSGYWWGEGVSPLGPSLFLEEIRAVCEAGAGTVAQWAPPPADDDTNPALAEPVPVLWPLSPAGSRYEAVREAAELVGHARAGLVQAGMLADGGVVANGGRADGALAEGGAGAGPGEPLTDKERLLAQAWERDTTILLAEREERRGDAAAAVALPGRLSVSSLVTMAADPAELARQIRRPMPRPPAPQARRGSAFHQWLEERFGQQRLIDSADLLGAADEPADDGDEDDLALLRERFEAGEWGGRWPLEVEVPFETLIAGRSVRGRIDAVFGDADDGGYDVVDWKTGQLPASDSDRQAAAVQLAAYRLAWAGLARVPLGQVRAAFYYVREDVTLRPADLLDEAGLAALIESIPPQPGSAPTAKHPGSGRGRRRR
ncbi:MAG TPA: ATP-dependent DNA helicase [Streptosporangiaceae bacterium]|nr:ATP-dependent DNA helicase [Streptosporangiaceae bacterium]